MKLTLLSDSAIRLEPAGPSLTIEARSPELHFSPFHMMAGALAHCSLSVLFIWGEHARLQTSDLTLEIAWTFADDPYRVACYDVRFDWPSLPGARLDAAKRVIEACTVHATLQHPPRITIEGTAGAPAELPSTSVHTPT
jgi:uncharacterized OsmC-like protein